MLTLVEFIDGNSFDINVASLDDRVVRTVEISSRLTTCFLSNHLESTLTDAAKTRKIILKNRPISMILLRFLFLLVID